MFNVQLWFHLFANQYQQVHNDLPQDVPASTGSGQNVEVTVGIMESITALANSPHDIFSNPKQLLEDTDTNMDVDGNGDDQEDDGLDKKEIERESQYESAYMEELSKSTSNFSNRCSKFQQYLLKLIKHTTSNANPSGTGTDGSDSAPGAGYTKKEMVQVANFERQIATLQNTCSALELQVKELGKARDEANDSERRVRRGLYRVSSGRLKIAEVLQVSVLRTQGLLCIWMCFVETELIPFCNLFTKYHTGC